MISDDIFRSELDAILKRRKVKKADRNETIEKALRWNAQETRDAVLDSEELLTREYEQEQTALKHIPTEFKEQCDFVAWFRAAYPGVVIYSQRNHGTRTQREKVEQVMEGLVAGASDLHCPKYGLYIEFKRIKGSEWSIEQQEFKRHIEEDCGLTYILAYGCEDGKNKVLQFINDSVE